MRYNLSMREELIILSLIYCFALCTIPMILFSKSVKQIKNARTNESSEEKNLRAELLMNSISILEYHNHRMKTSSKIDFADIIYSPMTDLRNIMNVDIKVVKNSPRRFIKKTWKKFNYINNSTLKSNSLKIPQKVDWRNEMNVISQVEKQKCADCSTVAVIETIESMHAIQSAKLMNLSIEQMDICNDVGMGCEGGNPSNLLQWLLVANDGRVMTNEKFIESNKSCNTNTSDDDSSIVKVKDYSHNDFTGHEELMLLYLAYQGPLIAEIDSLPIVSYQDEEVVEANCDGDLNHVVQIVGYDLTSSIPFYIIKNSWGKNWGSDGYFRVAIGKNVCGIAREVTTVITDYNKNKHNRRINRKFIEN